MEKLCDFFIKILEWWSKGSYYTYASLNIWLFFILEPLLILTFMALTIVGTKTKSEITKKRIRIFTYITFGICIIIPIVLIAIPMLNGVSF